MTDITSSYQYPTDPKYRPFLDSAIFFAKVALACTLTAFLISNLYMKLAITSSEWFYVPPLISLIHALIYYPWGFVLYNMYDKDYLKEWKVPRPRKVAKQTMDWDLLGTAQGEMIGIMMNYAFFGVAVIIGGMTFDSLSVPAIEFSLKSLGKLFFWYLFCIWWADLSFYTSHYWFHNSTWAYRNIHKKHHSFQYQVGWSAEVKTLTESVLVSTTDLLPHLVFPGHTIHMLAWIIVGVIYNIEGHSGYSLIFIKQYGFHDWHHTKNTGNLGIAFYLDHLAQTSQQWVKWIKNHKSH